MRLAGQLLDADIKEDGGEGVGDVGSAFGPTIFRAVQLAARDALTRAMQRTDDTEVPNPAARLRELEGD